MPKSFLDQMIENAQKRKTTQKRKSTLNSPERRRRKNIRDKWKTTIKQVISMNRKPTATQGGRSRKKRKLHKCKTKTRR